VVQAYVVRLGRGLVVAEDDRDIDLAGAQQFQRLGRVRVGDADPQAGMLAGQRCCRPRCQGADGGREAGQAHPSGGQPHMGGELRVGGFDPADDLGGSKREQLAGLSEPDTAADPLQQLRARLGLEPSEMVADRRLRVVQVLRGGGDRTEAGDGVYDPQSGDVQHPSSISMNTGKTWHWTYGLTGRTLKA
jgi:hypothetical protein